MVRISRTQPDHLCLASINRDGEIKTVYFDLFSIFSVIWKSAAVSLSDSLKVKKLKKEK